MRIAGGRLRGRELRVAKGVRPTGGRARAALFDIWARRLPGCRFLDLFAGSGAVGLEALSRGAAFCLAVEGGRAAARVLGENFARLLPHGGWRLLEARLPAALSRPELGAAAPFDLVFADPPYDHAAWRQLLAGIAPLLAGDGELAIEHGRRNRPPEAAPGLALDRRRAYGDSELSFYRSLPLSEARPR